MGLKDVLRDVYYVRNVLLVILVPILLLPLLLVEKRSETQCAYVVIIMAVFWVTEALPISVTALLPVFLFPAVGVMSVKDTASQYVNDTSMLFIGGLIVAAAIEEWNIHRRIALAILLKVGSNPRWLMLGLMFPTWFLSMWISNTATTAMMVPIASAILVQLKETQKAYSKGEVNEAVELDDIETDLNVPPPYSETNGYHTKTPDTKVNGVGEMQDQEIQVTQASEEEGNFGKSETIAMSEDDDPSFKRLCKCITLSIAYAANVGGIGSLTGTGPNLVLKGQLDIVYEKYGIDSPITFANWLAFGVPTSFVLMLLVWIWLQIFFLRCGGVGTQDKEQSARVTAVIHKEFQKLGRISFAQAVIGGHFILLAVLWITRDMGGEYGWGSLFTKGYVKDGVPAVFVACLLFVFPSEIPKIFCLRPSGFRQPLQPLMSWKAASDKIPWGVVFLLGGGFAMAKASQTSGLSAWVGEKLSVLDYLEPWVLNLVLCYIVAAMTEVTSNTATCTLMMPILANLAVHLQQNPLYLMFPTAIATSFAFMLPVATPPNAVVFSYGYVRVIDMVMAGILLNICCVLLLIGSTETLGNHLFDFQNIPDAILETYNKTA